MTTERKRRLNIRKWRHGNILAVAADIDSGLMDHAIEEAASLRHFSGIGAAETGMPSNEEVAIGLLVRAAAAGIVKYAASFDAVDMVTGRMQVALQDAVREKILEGKPFGRLHS